MPTPDDLRKEVNGYLEEVADKLSPFIDTELRNKAGDFVEDGKISINISEIDNEEGEFYLYDEVNDIMYDGEYEEDEIKVSLIKIIINFLKKKYNEEGWKIKVDSTNYILEFSEKDGKAVIVVDDSVTRSELLDLEE